MLVKSVLHETYKKPPLITIVCPSGFFYFCIVFHKKHTVSTIMTIAMSFLESLSPGLGICWPSLCEGWGLCPSQVLTRNDETMWVLRRFHHCIRWRTHKPRSHPKETWWKYLRVNVWWTHEISILTFCDTFERTSWNTTWESPTGIIGDCQTHWSSAWPHDQAFILQICLRTSVCNTAATFL